MNIIVIAGMPASGKSTVSAEVSAAFGYPVPEKDNLMFAGRCISVDDQVIGSVRVMPCCMAMGQAAGIGAALALERAQTAAEVNVDDIRAERLHQNAILEQ